MCTDTILPLFYVLGCGYNLFKLVGVPEFWYDFSFASQMVLSQGIILKLGIITKLFKDLVLSKET